MQHHRTCTLCDAMCGIVVEHENGQVKSIKGDPHDPLSAGHVCPKVVGLKDLHEDPDRLRTPLKREGDRWLPISWEQAFDEVAARILEVKQQHGKHAVALYQGNPSVHSLGAMTFGQLFAGALHTKNKFSATSIDQLPHMRVALDLYGHQLMMSVPDIDRTDLLVILGGNPLVSNGSLMSGGDIGARLKALKARGGKLVVIDPRRTETAALASEFHFIRPGADALLLMAMIHTLFDEGRVKPGRLAGILDGLDRVRQLAARFTPEQVAAAVGIDAPTIRGLARAVADAERACVYGRLGVCTAEFGGLAVWAIQLLNILTGRLDAVGGAMFARPAVDGIGLTARIGRAGTAGRYFSRVRGLPEFGGELPVATLAEEIDTPGDGQIRALVTSCGNPALSAPNGPRMEKALASLDLLVCIDLYLNETSRHAHYILPPTSALERSHYDLAFHMLAVRNTARWSDPLSPRDPAHRHDWEIYLELSRRLNRHGNPLRRMGQALMHRYLLDQGPDHIIDLGLRMGPYGAGLNPLRKGLSLSALRKQPSGVDLGPHVPCLPARLFTANRRIQLVPDAYAQDLDRLSAALHTNQPDDGSLLLIGRRSVRSNNSWMHNLQRLNKGPVECTLHMHPTDAAAHSLEEGAQATLETRVGTVTVPVHVTDTLMPGVVSLPHGWGHHRPGTRLQVAASRAGVSANDLTDEARVDKLTGNAVFNGVPVKVRLTTAAATAKAPLDAPADDVTASPSSSHA